MNIELKQNSSVLIIKEKLFVTDEKKFEKVEAMPNGVL